MNKTDKKPILLIDSTCKFCSASMQFIINRGGENRFIFLSIYSDEGKKILGENGLSKDYDKSLVLIENNRAYVKSDAVLRVSTKLNGIWQLLYWLKVIPKILRDPVYDFISRHRHKFY